MRYPALEVAEITLNFGNVLVVVVELSLLTLAFCLFFEETKVKPSSSVKGLFWPVVCVF